MEKQKINKNWFNDWIKDADVCYCICQRLKHFYNSLLKWNELMKLLLAMHVLISRGNWLKNQRLNC